MISDVLSLLTISIIHDLDDIDGGTVDLRIEISNGYVHLPARTVCEDFGSNVVRATLGVDESKRVLSIVWVSNSDLGHFTGQDLINEEPLDLSERVMMAGDYRGVLYLQGN